MQYLITTFIASQFTYYPTDKYFYRKNAVVFEVAPKFEWQEAKKEKKKRKKGGKEKKEKSFKKQQSQLMERARILAKIYLRVTTVGAAQ